jgi:MFS family permease
MTFESRRGVLVGAFIALFVPTSDLLLAQLVGNRIAPYEQTRSLLDVIGLLSWTSLFVLGPIGIVIAGRSGGVRGALAWLALLIVALPLYAVAWFASARRPSAAPLATRSDPPHPQR